MHLDFLYIPVAWVLLRWHQLFTAAGMPSDNGWTWTLSIVFLVITARLLLFGLFVKQVHYQRNMQRIAPKIQKLRAEHKNDRAELNRQIMALQQSEGFNPLAGCLPMLLQIPMFVGLYHVLRHISNSNELCNATGRKGATSKLLELYTFSGGQDGQTCSAARAHIFSSPLAASFHDKASVIIGLGGDPHSTRILVVIVLIISAAATFATQLLVRASATTPAEGTAATVQKLLLYLIPVGTLASGLLFNFPLGVLLYWFTSNLWTLGQQAYIVRFHPPTDNVDGPVSDPGPPNPERRTRNAQPKSARPAGRATSRQTTPSPAKPAAQQSKEALTTTDVIATSTTGRRRGLRRQRPLRETAQTS